MAMLHISAVTKGQGALAPANPMPTNEAAVAQKVGRKDHKVKLASTGEIVPVSYNHIDCLIYYCKPMKEELI